MVWLVHNCIQFDELLGHRPEIGYVGMPKKHSRAKL